MKMNSWKNLKHEYPERGRMLPPPHCNVVPPSQLELKISRLTLWSNQIEFTLKLFFKLVFSVFLRAWLNPLERQLMDLSILKSLAVFDLIKWRISSMSSFPAIFLSNPALIVYTVRNLPSLYNILSVQIINLELSNLTLYCLCECLFVQCPMEIKRKWNWKLPSFSDSL